MQRGNYTVHLSNGEKIEMRFTTWGFKKFCKDKGISVDELFEYIGNGLMRTEDVIQFMLIGTEYLAFLKKEEFKYTEFDACNWLDDMGGLTTQKVIDIAYIIMSALIDKDVEQVKELVEAAVQKAVAGNGHTEKKSGERVGGRYIRKQPKQD
jgi:peroxiredoxin family protein